MDMTPYVYQPLRRFEFPSMEHCRAKVLEDTDLVVFRQCKRPFTEMVQGFGFCAQHAGMVKDALARECAQEGI